MPLFSFLFGFIKFIAIAFAYILALLIFITAAFILIPFRYNIQIHYDKKLLYDVKVTWLFKIASIIFTNGNNKNNSGVLIFGRKFQRTAKNKKANSGGKHKHAERMETLGDEFLEEEVKSEEPLIKEVHDEPAKHEKKIENEQKVKNKKTGKTVEYDSDESDEGLFPKLNRYLNEAKKIYNHPDRDRLIKLTLNLMRRLFETMMPEKLEIAGEIGFEKPDITGRALGALAVISCMNGVKISVDGNFEETAFKIELNIKGKLALWSLIWPLTAYVSHKPVWKIILKYIFRKGDKHE